MAIAGLASTSTAKFPSLLTSSHRHWRCNFFSSPLTKGPSKQFGGPFGFRYRNPKNGWTKPPPQDRGAQAPDPSRPQWMENDLLDLMEITKFRSEEHTSELQSLMRISYAVFC